MSWYKIAKLSRWIKTASITFSLNDAYKISQPKNMLDLSFDIFSFINKKVLAPQKSPMSINDISPDGDDYDKMTGTINVYVFDESNLKEIENIVKSIIEEYSQYGFVMNYKIDNSRSGRKVFRLNVTENPTINYPELPEINMANDNALSIMRLIGLNGYTGRESLSEIKKRILAVSQEEMQKEVEPNRIITDKDLDLPESDPADWWKDDSSPVPKNPNSNEIQIMHRGRDIEYIDNRLQGLYGIVDFGLQNGFKYIVWG